MSDAPALPKGILLPLAFVNFTIGAGAFLVIALLAPLTQSLALSKAQAGWVMGAYALSDAYDMERHVRDTRVHQILEGTNEIMRVIIARRMAMDGALEAIK